MNNLSDKMKEGIFDEFKDLEEFKLNDEQRKRLEENPELLWIALQRMVHLHCVVGDEPFEKEQVKDLENIRKIINFVDYDENEGTTLGWFSQYK